MDIVRELESVLRTDRSSKAGRPYASCHMLPTEEPLPCVIICPGGGYEMTAEHEGLPIAESYARMGFHAIILQYRISPELFPSALIDLARTVAFLRFNARKLQIRPDALIICGFSAGGHLAASLGVHWDSEILRQVPGFDPKLSRPDGMILCYPVISFLSSVHAGSIRNLLGSESSDPKMLELLSCDRQVSSKTPPTFLWHTAEDTSVPAEHSMLFAKSLIAHDIPCELHIFPEGPHGIALANERTDIAKDGAFVYEHSSRWFDLSCRWIRECILKQRSEGPVL